ncbi:hypothetical protein TPHA_0A00600 [Tetrapisispora phaffii CBS 4417]|uniref:Large ribosomal subunit protein uL15/eL18 domain-containing protein n=1 Tax=Tetrapisispora phaffii (strain ATCC 24235 / CBS 4417 / NBRC 1672 / NRRL Y-8282 / UCD 70-5) TaxID=1071381 RepID=G8BML7_TETPH|nr:mitochondrial 54S ribosomal protein YmL10/YmL18 TPHA_0A00600 [Tetrapisispora phaffii CBS 4417]CCE61145.1 hypothetical protein TPHA_0A00600 [Tetrapisispora phaffii CBS 4417]
MLSLSSINGLLLRRNCISISQMNSNELLKTLALTRRYSLLGNLKPTEGSTKKYKRVGRGPSSGKGKTSARGQKGQKARSSVKPWFEGGQTPIYKLFPKVGFINVHATPMNELNLEKIQRFHNEGRLLLNEDNVLDMKTMKDIGLVTGVIKHGVKILTGRTVEYNLPIKIEASRASEKAIEAIEKAGGEFTAKYFNKLGLRAHLSPDWFLEKRGRLPLPARPIKRKDIDYYTKESSRSYLIKEDHPFYQDILNARSSQGSKSSRMVKGAKKSALEIQLEKLSSEATSNVSSFDSKVITLEDMQS